MDKIKSFFADIGNWIFNNLIRLEPGVKSIVLLLCFAALFWCIRCYVAGVGKKVKGLDGKERHSSQCVVSIIVGFILLLYVILLLIY